MTNAEANNERATVEELDAEFVRVLSEANEAGIPWRERAQTMMARAMMQALENGLSVEDPELSEFFQEAIRQGVRRFKREQEAS